MLGTKKYFLHFSFYFLIFISSIFISPFIGSSKISVLNALNDPLSIDYLILINQRIPRLITGLFCGAGLGAAGSALQLILRNPLAEPYVLGISGMSALFLCFTIVVLNGLFPPGGAAFIGALAAVFMIDYSFVRFRNDSNSTILTGVCINIFASSLILFLKYFATPDKLVIVERWFMGSLDVLGFENLFIFGAMILFGIFIIIFFATELNILGFDIEIARARGINPEKIRRFIYFATGLITASIVWIAGPIGFVGLIIPHFVKRLSGNDMKILIPGSAFLGSGFLITCDVFSRILIPPAELPVGIITAITGTPVFFIILFKINNRD